MRVVEFDIGLHGKHELQVRLRSRALLSDAWTQAVRLSFADVLDGSVARLQRRLVGMIQAAEPDCLLADALNDAAQLAGDLREQAVAIKSHAEQTAKAVSTVERLAKHALVARRAKRVDRDMSVRYPGALTTVSDDNYRRMAAELADSSDAERSFMDYMIGSHPIYLYHCTRAIKGVMQSASLLSADEMKRRNKHGRLGVEVITPDDDGNRDTVFFSLAVPDPAFVGTDNVVCINLRDLLKADPEIGKALFSQGNLYTLHAAQKMYDMGYPGVPDFPLVQYELRGGDAVARLKYRIGRDQDKAVKQLERVGVDGDAVCVEQIEPRLEIYSAKCIEQIAQEMVLHLRHADASVRDRFYEEYRSRPAIVDELMTAMYTTVLKEFNVAAYLPIRSDYARLSPAVPCVDEAYIAALNGDLRRLDHWLERGHDINGLAESNMVRFERISPIMMAVSRQDVNFVRGMLERGYRLLSTQVLMRSQGDMPATAKPEVVTLLLMATYTKNADMTELLLDQIAKEQAAVFVATPLDNSASAWQDLRQIIAKSFPDLLPKFAALMPAVIAEVVDDGDDYDGREYSDIKYGYLPNIDAAKSWSDAVFERIDQLQQGLDSMLAGGMMDPELFAGRHVEASAAKDEDKPESDYVSALEHMGRLFFHGQAYAEDGLDDACKAMQYRQFSKALTAIIGSLQMSAYLQTDSRLAKIIDTPAWTRFFREHMAQSNGEIYRVFLKQCRVDMSPLLAMTPLRAAEPKVEPIAAGAGVACAGAGVR